MTDERNIALRLSYDGSAYHGWQTQKHEATVCQTITRALDKTLEQPTVLHGCGRTDAGVHARTYVANFRTRSRIPTERLPYALNSRLPQDICVERAVEVAADFDAILSCTRKEYSYFLLPGPLRDVFWHRRVYPYKPPLNMARMRAAAAQLVGTHDFACVRTQGSPVKSTVRTLYELEITEQPLWPFGGAGNARSVVVFRMSADGFLYNMARALAGTLLYVSEGKITDIPALLASGDRSRAGPVLPPSGLYMTGVWYDGEVL